MQPNKWLIDVYHDGFRWCAILGGDFLGRFDTEALAFAHAMREKMRIAGI
jgi:hypothetical protein